LASYILLKIIIIAFTHSNETISNGEKENVFWNPDFSLKKGPAAKNKTPNRIFCKSSGKKYHP